MCKKLFQINPMDNVAVALQDISPGDSIYIENEVISAPEAIRMSHKAALCDIKKGQDIIKYGAPIGIATQDIFKGRWVHTDNLKTKLSGLLDYTFSPGKSEHTPETPGTYMGYRRENGKVGIRNEIWIVITVGCVSKTAALLETEANKRFGGRTDGIFAFTHPYGCSQTGDDHTSTQRILKGLVNHPNAAGVLVLGLGCENNNITEFKKMLGDYNPQRIRFLSTQDTEDEIESGLSLIEQLVEYAQQFAREEVSMSELVVGLKCGGSDAFSGITANPLVGRFSDKLVAKGGTTILTEVPEMFGAEQILMNRCRDKETFKKTVDLINGFKTYFLRHGQEIDENPSPGNKQGGITTLEEKSLGCTQKGGTSAVQDVLDYGSTVSAKGLNLLDGPGNDIVACTALAAAGAQLILFTTGRGTPLGGPVPTLKISSNTELAHKKPNWIDFDAGVLLHQADMDSHSLSLYEAVRNIASGKQTKNEQSGYREIAIFKDGVTL